MPVFCCCQYQGNVETPEMLRIFNCGIGMVIIVSKECAMEVQQLISQSGEEALAIGHVAPRLPGNLSTVPMLLLVLWVLQHWSPLSPRMKECGEKAFLRK